LNSKDKIPYVSYRNGAVHNFWQDATHVRGVWRTSTLDSYLSEDTAWETVLDFDMLAKAEDKNWVYKGNSCLAPTYERCIVNLSDGGKDAVIRREFNTKTKTWVEDGFITEESKGTMAWLDEDTMVIGVDFGEGTMTDSGYPMIAKLWKRGTPLSEAVEIGRGEQADVGYWPGVYELSDGRREIVVSRSQTFYDSETFWFPLKDGELGEGVKFPIPTKADLGGEFKGQVLLSLNEDWRGFKTGDLVSFAWDDFAKDGEISDIALVYRPDEKSSMNGYGITKSKVLLATSTDVKGAVHEYDFKGLRQAKRRKRNPCRAGLMPPIWCQSNSSRPQKMARKFRILLSARKTRKWTGPTRPCFMVMVGLKFRLTHLIPRHAESSGSKMVGFMSSPIFAAAGNMGRNGIRQV